MQKMHKHCVTRDGLEDLYEFAEYSDEISATVAGITFHIGENRSESDKRLFIKHALKLMNRNYDEKGDIAFGKPDYKSDTKNVRLPDRQKRLELQKII